MITQTAVMDKNVTESTGSCMMKENAGLQRVLLHNLSFHLCSALLSKTQYLVRQTELTVPLPAHQTTGCREGEEEEGG